MAYAFFGVCTTIVNVAAYYVCARLLGVSTAWSTIVAWLLAVLFAFATNKSLVFGSKSWKRGVVVREIASFYLCRIATGVIDLGIMIASVDILGWNDVVMKMVANVIVIVLNFIASKFIIFKRGKEISEGKKQISSLFVEKRRLWA